MESHIVHSIEHFNLKELVFCSYSHCITFRMHDESISSTKYDVENNVENTIAMQDMVAERQ